MRPHTAGPASQRGVALLIVLVVLFIVAVLMVDISLTAATARRSAHNASTEFLMDAAIEGHFQVAVAQILYDQSENNYDGGDDRWAREEYTKFESKSQREKDQAAAASGPAPAKAGGEEEGGVRVLGDSDDIAVTTRIEDEERKFNLYLLLKQADTKKQDEAREKFAVLLDRFREDTPLDLSRTRAEELKDRIVDYINRDPPGEGEKGKIPLPRTGKWCLLTPDELRNAEGLEDRDHAMPAEGILYDAREPRAVKAWLEDPGNNEPPKVYPGLLRYVTLWSGGAWAGKVDADAMKRMVLVNLNTAEKPVLETLFAHNPGDFTFVDKIIEYRGAPKEDSKTTSGEAPKADEPLPQHQYFQKFEDLKKVDGLEDGTVLARNGIDGTTVTFSSDTFSVDILAERDETSKQVRTVVRRNKLAAGSPPGYQTLLREERADPRFEEKKAEDDAEAGK